MTTLPVDAQFAFQNASYNEAVQRKLSMDAMRKRLGDGRTEEQKLRESCEGFESLFIQKMWEQMRKTLPKEGYLHSKDEETYQSMFDVELSKKMASSGGIGLADMLYEQLSQKLTSAAKSTTTNPNLNTGIAIQPSVGKEVKDLTMGNLYTPLEGSVVENVDTLSEEAASLPPSVVSQALDDLQHMVIADDVLPAQPVQPLPAEGIVPLTSVEKAQLEILTKPKTVQAQELGQSNLQGQSWLSNTKVSAKPKPLPKNNALGEGREVGNPEPQANASSQKVADVSFVSEMAANTNGAGVDNNSTSVSNIAVSQMQTPQETASQPTPVALPVEGRVVQNFGWEKTTSGQKWNGSTVVEAKQGQFVRAPLDGKVAFVGEMQGFGNAVVLEHAKGYQSIYGNVDAVDVQVGNTVGAGTNFAKVSAGSLKTGNGEDFALVHLLMKRGEMPLDPASTLRRISSVSS